MAFRTLGSSTWTASLSPESPEVTEERLFLKAESTSSEGVCHPAGLWHCIHLTGDSAQPGTFLRLSLSSMGLDGQQGETAQSPHGGRGTEPGASLAPTPNTRPGLCHVG